MSMAKATNLVEKALGHDSSAETAQDVSSFEYEGETDLMNALIWKGKNTVQVGTSLMYL